MNAGRSTIVGIVIMGATLCLSGVSLAEQGSTASPEHHQAKIKLLQDAVAALQSSQPTLANALSAYATEEANEPAHTNVPILGTTSRDMVGGTTVEYKEDRAKVGKEAEEAAEKHEEANHAAHLKLLRDSAAALLTSHPDLAARLTKSADRMVKHMKQHAKEDMNEAGEKNKKPCSCRRA